jgi:hypothetical protein
MIQKKVKPVLFKNRSIVASSLKSELDRSLSLTKTEALEFIRLVEEQRNAEQVERMRKLRIKNLMKKAGTQSPTVMEDLIKRLINKR